MYATTLAYLMLQQPRWPCPGLHSTEPALAVPLLAAVPRNLKSSR